MIAKIRNNPRLRIYLRDRIEDEGIEVGIDGNLSQNEYVGVKVDDYYNGLHQPTVPKSVDYVVVVDNSCDSYNLYILEMKNVNSPQKLVIKDIHEKFANTIADFLSEEFKEIFLADRYKYKDIKLYLVSDAYGIGGKYQTHKDYVRYLEKINKKDSLRVDRNLSSKIFKFRKRYLRIEYDIPPNPVIKKSY